MTRIEIETDHAEVIEVLEADRDTQGKLKERYPLRLLIGPWILTSGEHVIRQLSKKKEGPRYVVKYEIDLLDR